MLAIGISVLKNKNKYRKQKKKNHNNDNNNNQKKRSGRQQQNKRLTKKKTKKKQKKNKAGYKATSCGRVGRGRYARFPTFRLNHLYGRTNGWMDRRTDGQTDGRTD